MSDIFPATKRRGTSNTILFRVAPTGREWVEKMAERHSVTLSEVVKAALQMAVQDEVGFSKIIHARNEK